MHINFKRPKAIAENSDKELLTSLKQQGLKTSQGRPWKAVLITFLVEQIQIGTRSELKNLCTAGRAINRMVDQLGPGSLVSLYSDSTKRYVILFFCEFIILPGLRFRG